jgi:hypothetical protein
MAGRRRRRDRARPTRPRFRVGWWRERIRTASTSEEYYDRATDWHRAAVMALPEAERTGELNEVARWLADRADAIMRRAAA